MQVFTMGKNTYAVLLTRRAQHTQTQTHTQMKRKPKVLYSTLQPMSETSWGSEFGLYLVVGGKGVLGNAAPVTGRRPGPSRMCGTRGLWPAATWSNRSPRAEIRVADGTHQGSTNRPVHSPSSPTTVKQLVIARELQISTPSQSVLGDISPPTQGAAFVRIISLSVPNWPGSYGHSLPGRGFGHARRKPPLPSMRV